MFQSYLISPSVLLLGVVDLVHCHIHSRFRDHQGPNRRIFFWQRNSSWSWSIPRWHRAIPRPWPPQNVWHRAVQPTRYPGCGWDLGALHSCLHTLHRAGAELGHLLDQSPCPGPGGDQAGGGWGLGSWSLYLLQVWLVVTNCQLCQFYNYLGLQLGENLSLDLHPYPWQSRMGGSTWSGTRGRRPCTATPSSTSPSASLTCTSLCSSLSGFSPRRQQSSPSPSPGPQWSWRRSPPGWACWCTWPPWSSLCGDLQPGGACRQEVGRSLQVLTL